jgi:NCAIR mutase (PurE)-related protein
MDQKEIAALARQLQSGELTVEAFATAVGRPSAIPLEDTTLDVDRQRRCGFPEVVYGEGKTIATLKKILQALLDNRANVLATRVSDDKGKALGEAFPQGHYNAVGRTFRIDAPSDREKPLGRVAVVTAGTSDLPVAEEARETLDWMGADVAMVHDVGVAGPHRLLAHLDDLRACDAIVVVAGMEGALPSIVGGYVACPVVAVPTSVGYGSSFGGLAALLGMLNSCAANVTVVNIDGGFKGGYIAGLIAGAQGTARPWSRP